MDHVLATASELGWAEAQLHREYFTATTFDHCTDGLFELELRRSGRCILVWAHQSAAHALIDAGFRISLSDEQGVCSPCLSRALEGESYPRDLFLTEDEQQQNFMSCCARACAPLLVLDL